MSLNVLVVDDSAVMRAMIVKVLRLTDLDLGEVRQAANGREGLEALDQHWIDLVLSDVNMPVMDGQRMIETIRANPIWKDLPIVVISTEGSRTRIERLRELGAAFIHKPFTPEAIRDVVEQTTGVHHEQRI